MTEVGPVADIRAALAGVSGPDTDVLMIPLEGQGLRVKRVGRYYVDLLTMAYNFRLVTTVVDFPAIYDRYWCYSGKSVTVFTTALLAAAAWDASDDTEPLGWNKNGQTQEYRGGADG